MKQMALRIALCCLVLQLSLLFSSTASMHAGMEELQEQQCRYTLRVKTGDVPDAGTDSTISLELKSLSGDGFTIDDLITWGKMPPGHKYFQRYNLDQFSGVGTCLNVCDITVTSNGKGKEKGWYLEYVQITITGFGSKPFTDVFNVEQWLSLGHPPYSLRADVNKCSLAPAFSI